MGKKLQKIYLTYHNLLIVQDLWQAHHQILSLIFLKEFIKFIKCKYRHDDKKCEIVELNTNITTAFFNTQSINMI